MKGYGSHFSARAKMFKAIHTMTITVCQNRYLPVPGPRASFSENLPKVSGSIFTANRFGRRGWSSRRFESSSATACLLNSRGVGGVSSASDVVQAGFAPVLRQQVVEHVVDGHRAQQVILLVEDRPAAPRRHRATWT